MLVRAWAMGAAHLDGGEVRRHHSKDPFEVDVPIQPPTIVVANGALDILVPTYAYHVKKKIPK